MTFLRGFNIDDGRISSSIQFWCKSCMSIVNADSTEHEMLHVLWSFLFLTRSFSNNFLHLLNSYSSYFTLVTMRKVNHLFLKLDCHNQYFHSCLVMQECFICLQAEVHNLAKAIDLQLQPNGISVKIDDYNHIGTKYVT